MIPRVFIITDRAVAPEPAPTLAPVLSVLPPGETAVVLREKDLPVREHLALGRALRALTKSHGALLIIAGRLDLALACGADGVHFGREAPSSEDARPLLPTSMLVGSSIHAGEPAPLLASYAFLSPIFPTSSKPLAAPLGLDGLRATAQRSRTPLVALGGIDESNAGRCLDSGASAVALRSRLLGADRLRAARALAEIIASRP